MSWLVSVACLLLAFPAPLQGKASEYQLEAEPLRPCELLRGEAVAGRRGHAPHCMEDGRFRPVQCTGRGQECWCVDAEGQEIVGTRTNNPVLHCATPCQQQALLRCSPSGLFEAVQCDASRGQCWCVDQEGAELYGTRQNGRPPRCPGSCEVRSRRLLHGSAPSSPPQCTADGDFLPVQCRFVNTTDRAEVDLLHAFNSFPEAFETFSSFQKFFPQVSSYCFCADTRGRELQDTGVELLLSQVYDSAFAGLPSGRSASQTNVYRVLQRRMLGVRLALTGRFRCPSPCEEERRAALAASSAFVPSCEAGGEFSSRQCQGEALCWCVDAKGAELPGTRRQGDAPLCGPGPADCPSQRRLALSRLLSGPVAPPSSGSASGSSSPCRSLLRPLKPLLPAEADTAYFLSQLVEVLHGLFPSVGGALHALAVSPSPRRLQENLFGGRFLQQLAAANLSAALGSEGAVGVKQVAAAKNQNLIQTVSRVLQDHNFLSALQLTVRELGSSASHTLQQVLTPLLRSCSEEGGGVSIFVPRCTHGGGFQEVQCGGGACWCVDPRGQEVVGSRTAGLRPPRCPSRCQRERAAALEVSARLAAGAQIQVPACSEGGAFLPLQCVGDRCFCVDAEGRAVGTGPAGGAVKCPQTSSPPPPPPLSGCLAAAAEVAAFRKEAASVVALSNSSHIPLGYGFLLAEGLRLTPEELQIDQSETERLLLSDRLLSRSNAALRLAAFSTLQMLRPPQRRSYQPYTPQCDAGGRWLPTQCYHSTGQCWCVDEDGDFISGSLTGRSLILPKCLTRCERAQAHTLLSDWTKGSDVSASPYRPTCQQDGSYSVLQTGGAAGWCVNPQTGETIQAATASAAGLLTCPSWCQLQGLQCRPDGVFTPLQCDSASCWCVSEDGQEVGGTRTARQSGNTPSCDRPLCPAPVVTHGALLCRPAADGRQSCDLVCHRGYHISLPVSSFLCDPKSQRWGGDSRPVGGACQILQPLQTLSWSQTWSLASSCSQTRTLQPLLFSLITSRGLCSAQFPVSPRSVPLCSASSVNLTCDGEASLRLKVTWTLTLSDVPTSDLPDLHDLTLFLNASSLLEQVQGILGNVRSELTSDPKLVSMTTALIGCSHGYRLDSVGDGCLVCPAGSFSREGACLLCPEGTYQDEEGRDFCNRCPRGSSPSGAWSVNQCVTQCEGRGLRCSPSGDFLPAQRDASSDRWRCVSSEGVDLEWTLMEQTLTDEECSVLRRFQDVPTSQLMVGSDDAQVLQTMTSDLSACVRACAAEPSCHHVALSNTQCELYSTHTLNTHCNASQQTRGFLGNPGAEFFDWLRCSLKVRGGASDMLIIRKKEFSSQRFVRTAMKKALSGVFRTQVFSTSRTSLADAHRHCEDGCSRDACCDGILLSHNMLNGGSLFCGWLRTPSVLMCGDQDWDVIGQGKANRICGVGLTYNKLQRSFLFDFGGEKFSFADSGLPEDSKDKKDYQTSVIISQAVYLSPDSAPSSAAADSGSPPCPAVEDRPPVDGSVLLKFRPVSQDEIQVDAGRTPPSLTFALSRRSFSSQDALRWCLERCDSEPQCSLADLRDHDSAGFFRCSLLADSRVCSAYDRSLSFPCRHLLDRSPNNTYSKTVDLSGPVKSFYQRVSFQKMVSYSVRSLITLTANTPLSSGFRQCERLCDEDPCCRGFGFVGYKANKTAGRSEVKCLPLISLGVQTCSEEDVTSWRTQDCRPSGVMTSPDPFGWYQKPVNQWTSSPALCPPFSLPPTKNNVSADEWRPLAAASLLVDPSLTTYDVIHVSRDIAADPDATRVWCLHACQEAESCVAVSLQEVESATRCVLYPDTTACGLGSSHPASSQISCRLVVREPAPQVFLRTERLPSVTSVSVPGRGVLRGIAVETAVASERRRVVQFLGVPYARPPTGALRFQAAEPADWTGSWDATGPRSGCVQPGDAESAGSSEDCLYLNVFAPAALRGRVPVFVFFFNPSTIQKPGLLDGSALAAVGNIVVVTASYRTAALGFLTTGGLRGNYGLSDQEAVLRWVHAHIHLVGGDKERVTVGAEGRGADIASLHLFSSSSSSPLFHRMMLMGGSVFSPSGLQTASTSQRQAQDLARELGCATSDLTQMVACLRAAPVQQLNTAQTKLLALSGPFLSWAPAPPPAAPSSLLRVDLLLGTSQHDGLISRARKIKDFEALQGRADSKTAFYEALSRSLGGASGNAPLKEAAAWFYSLDHAPSAAGYSLFSRALENATRDLFIICPTLQMASHWADSGANVFMFHQPDSSAHSRADASAPLDVQMAFGSPHHPISSQRFSSSERRLSVAMMTYVSSFVRRGNPNPSYLWAESALPRWQPVQSSDASPTYLQLSPAPHLQKGLRRKECSFWTQLGSRLTAMTGELGAEPLRAALTPRLPLAAAPSSQSKSEKDAYS
ncbi:unnamed protein product [Ophioblennius macclurei]